MNELCSCLCVWIEFINKNRVGSLLLASARECQQASMFVTLLAKRFFFRSKQAKRTKSAQIKIDWVGVAAAATPATNRMIYNASRISKDCCFILFYFYIIHIFSFFFVHMWSCGAYFFFRSTTFSTSDFHMRTIYVLRGWWFFQLPFAFCSLASIRLFY